MKTVLAPNAPWPKKEPDVIVHAYKPKAKRPNPRVFKPDLTEVDFFRETRETLAKMKDKKK